MASTRAARATIRAAATMVGERRTFVFPASVQQKARLMFEKTRPLVLLFVFAAGSGCQPNPTTTPPPKASAEPAVGEKVEAAGLHNVFRISEKLYSGSSPEGEEGFQYLQKLGVKTIISVDGAKPEVETARKYG